MDQAHLDRLRRLFSTPPSGEDWRSPELKAADALVLSLIADLKEIDVTNRGLLRTYEQKLEENAKKLDE
jgi:hypothetical protein